MNVKFDDEAGRMRAARCEGEVGRTTDWKRDRKYKGLEKRATSSSLTQFMEGQASLTTTKHFSNLAKPRNSSDTEFSPTTEKVVEISTSIQDKPVKYKGERRRDFLVVSNAEGSPERDQEMRVKEEEESYFEPKMTGLEKQLFDRAWDRMLNKKSNSENFANGYLILIRA